MAGALRQTLPRELTAVFMGPTSKGRQRGQKEGAARAPIEMMSVQTKILTTALLVEL